MKSRNIFTENTGQAVTRARSIKLVAWMNIAIQVAFPLAGTFTPVMASVDSDRKYLINSADHAIQTQVYTLSPGDSLDSVAKKFNTTPDALRKLNQLRTFARGIDNLQSGDELDVPSSPLPVIQWDECFAGITADSDRKFLPDSADHAIQTQVYTLSFGESFDSVIKKFNMAPDAMRKLNQFRTFARGIDNLQPGDELDVPVSPLPVVKWNDCTSDMASIFDSKRGDGQAQKLAGVASQAGSFLANNPNGDAAANMARGMATAEASNQIQQWLSRFGTARVQLDADKNFSLKSSKFELLVPLYEQKDRLVFTQSSLHRTDDRAQSNLGLGYRWFTDTWMLGGNTFLDYDLSRDHTRMGMGIEYWRDSLKMGVNSYQRLTSWKNSPDVTDYEERPANGWDIRAQAWLPSLPQLGGKLTFEQYYGDEVALFGKDNRQRDPHAITAGVNYTPVPLLTFSAEQRQGKSGEHDTRFGVDVSYQLGVPWQHQINPNAVAAMRSLAGSRYDLIERNNNIVLEYRKKQVIHLYTADLIAGYAGEQKSLGVSVNSKYGLESIDWSASSLVAAGGKIVQTGADYAVVLPDWKSGPGGVNTYTIGAVAFDKKGNMSNQRETQVTVTQAAIDIKTSMLSPSDITLPADGKTQRQLVLKVNDRDGNHVDIAASEISVKKTAKQHGAGYSANYGTNGTSGATVSDFTRKSAGEYVATLRAGTMPESFTLTPSARNTDFASTNVSQTADNSTALIDILEVVTNNVIADGKTKGKVKVVVVDAQNNLVPGQTVSLKADKDALVTNTVITNEQGEAAVSVTSIRAGDAMITASVNGNRGKEAKLTFLPDRKTARIIQKDLTVLPESSVADGKTPKAISARVTDAQGNPVPDALVAFSANNGASAAAATIKSDAQGLVGTVLTSTTAGKSRVSARVNNTATSRDTTFTGNNATALVTSVLATEAAGVSDGKTAVTFTTLIKDQNGNPLPGIPVDWQSDKDGSYVVFGKVQTLTNDKGIAQTSVTSTKAYVNVVVTASTNASSKAAAPFTFVADNKHGLIEQLTSNRQTFFANGTDTAQMTVKVTDTHGNPLRGMKVTLSSGKNAVIVPTQPTTNADGFAFATLATTQAGDVNVVVKLDNGVQKALTLKAEADTRSAVVTVKPSAITATAGQSAPLTLTATVVDAHSNPVSGTSVAWQTDHNQLNDAVSVTNQRGEAIISLSGTKAVMTTVTAVLYNGNKGTTKVTFGPAEPAQKSSTLSVSPQSITADETSAATATMTLRDQFDNPVPGQNVNWNASNGADIKVHAVEKGNGVYQASVTGTKEGSWDLTAASGKVTLQKSLGLLANQGTGVIHSVIVHGRNTAKADGVETVRLRVQVKDKNNNTQIQGLAVGWGTTLGRLSSQLSHTDQNGMAEIILSSKQAGEANVTAMLGGSAPITADKKVTFTAGNIDGGKSSLAVSTGSIVVETENATVSVIARDSEGNPLAGLKDRITLSFAPDLGMTSAKFNEVSSGVYESKVTGKKVGTTEISATVNGAAVSQKARLSTRADSASATLKGAINVTPTSAVISQAVTYSAVLTDKHGNALGAGIPVTWSANEGSILSAQVTKTNDTGTASVTLTRQKAGTAAVSIILPSGSTKAPDVAFSAGEPDESRSELTLSPPVIVAGEETSTLTLVLRDKYDNPLSGQTVSGTIVSGTASVSNSTAVTGKPGHYTMSVSGNRSGTATLAVKVNNKTFTQNRALTIKGDTTSWKITAVTPNKTSLIAGDTNGVTFSSMVTDAHGNKLPGVVVSWQLQGQSVNYAPTSRTDSNGVATTTVRSETAGQLNMTAWLDERNSLKANTVTVHPAEVDTAKSTFNADKTVIGSDGKEAVRLTVHLEDSFGNTIPGKNVSIQGADRLKGFSLTPVTDGKNGNYTVSGTSTAKGEVTLSALVDNKSVGQGIKVTVGAITPDLRFANSQQSAVYTRSFRGSQSVLGMPNGVNKSWSSSNQDVATVDGNSGAVTLLKSGETNITVYTPGNVQYNPAIASYTLKVDKADPGLKAGGGIITAKWADGQTHSIPSLFDNADVGNSLTAVYSSKSTGVVTVNNTGVLHAVKPGTATLTVSTPETAQFKAASVDVHYVLNKGTLDIRFATPTVETTDEGTFALQKPVTGIPSVADVSWESSDNRVVNPSVLGRPGAGRARLTLKAKENDYYTANDGYYDVVVYTKPSISLGDINYISKGKVERNGPWTPVFVGDDMSVTWNIDASDEFSKTHSATLYFKDANGNVLFSDYQFLPKGSQTTLIKAKNSYWGKVAYLELVAKGRSGTTLSNTVKSNNIQIKNLPPNQIWTELTVVSRVITRISSGYHDSSCQESYLGREHWNDAVTTGDRISFGGKRLISPMSLSAKVIARQNGRDKPGSFPDSYESVYSDQKIKFGSAQIASGCWRDHTGGYDIGIVVNYDGKEYKYWTSNSWGWGGAGQGMYRDNIDEFK